MSEHRYRSVVDNSPHGIYRVSCDGTCISVNPAFCALVGYAADELVASSISRLYERPEEQTRLLVDAAHHGGCPPNPVDIVWRRRDGVSITVRMWVHAERDESRGIVHFDGYVEDVTAVRATERALRQSQKLAAVGQVVSGVAHELNNPLAAILLFTDELLAGNRPEEDRTVLGVIAQQARRSRTIVRDLLSFVRSYDVVRASFAPCAFFDQMARTLQPQTAELGVDLLIEMDEIEAINADRAAMEQVVTNLVMNGAQATASTGSSGAVRILARAEQDVFVLQVEDDGPGIDDTVLLKIFEPFFTTKPVGQGTGLGLSVTRSIVERHGGTIVAENRGSAESRGARFTVRLPMAAIPAVGLTKATPGSVVAA